MLVLTYTFISCIQSDKKLAAEACQMLAAPESYQGKVAEIDRKLQAMAVEALGQEWVDSWWKGRERTLERILSYTRLWRHIPVLPSSRLDPAVRSAWQSPTRSAISTPRVRTKALPTSPTSK